MSQQQAGSNPRPHDHYAGINLTGYHPPPGTPGLLHQNVCPAPGLLHNRKCPGAGQINDDVPWAGHLHQHEDLLTQSSRLKN